MPVPNDSFRNACLVNDCFGGRAPLTTIFEALVAKDIFTADKHGNIEEIDGFRVIDDCNTTFSLSRVTPRRRDLMTSGGSLLLEDYLTPEEIAAALNEDEHRRLERGCRVEFVPAAQK